MLREQLNSVITTTKREQVIVQNLIRALNRHTDRNSKEAKFLSRFSVKRRVDGSMTVWCSVPFMCNCEINKMPMKVFNKLHRMVEDHMEGSCLLPKQKRKY